MGILYSALLAVFFYIAVVVSYKIMGKREISSLSIFDFVINLIIADVVATGIVEEDFWLDSLVGLIALVLIQIIVAKFQLKIPNIRKHINGEAAMLVKDGHLDFDQLKKLRIQLDELIMLLRQNNIVNIEEIQYAIMETNGKLSIYEKRLPIKTFPLPFVVSGVVKVSAIKHAGLQEEWLNRQLKQHDIALDKQIKYLFYGEKQLILHTKAGFKKIKLN